MNHRWRARLMSWGFSFAVLAPLAAKADYLPPGLQAGDPYQLLFITSATIDGASGEIDHYNRFANTVANGDGSRVQGVSSGWRALLSTREAHARDNAPVTAPVYNLEGALIATDASDLWDGDLKRGVRVTELGEVVNTRVWSGTTVHGMEASTGVTSPPPGDYAMGGSSPMVGWSGNSDQAWIFSGRETPANRFPIYVLSQVLSVPAPNVVPVADAGADQLVTRLGVPVALDGSASRDPDGDALRYAWAIARKPAGSAAQLSDPASPSPSITLDLHGAYQLELVVTDANGGVSAPDRVELRTLNLPPVADAGDNQWVVVGEVVRLDGRGSRDPNGEEISYLWEFAALPGCSVASFDDPSSPVPTFIPDRVGVYGIQLMVDDGELRGVADTISVTVQSPFNGAVALMGEVVELLRNLDPARFKQEKYAPALLKKLVLIVAELQKERIDRALVKLDGIELVKRIDGCSAGGAVDGNDWLLHCEDQLAVTSRLQRVRDYLTRSSGH